MFGIKTLLRRKRVHIFPTSEVPPIFTSIVQVSSGSMEVIERARLALHEDTDQSWDRVMFEYDLSFAGRHLLASGNWDEDRRQRVRIIIGQARQNFHRHPRPWWVMQRDLALLPVLTSQFVEV